MLTAVFASFDVAIPLVSSIAPTGKEQPETHLVLIELESWVIEWCDRCSFEVCA